MNRKKLGLNFIFGVNVMLLHIVVYIIAIVVVYQ